MSNLFSVATTPTFRLTLPQAVDLTEAENLYVSVSQGTRTVTKSGDAVTLDNAYTVSVYLAQEETVLFRAGQVLIQLNWTYANGSRACTNIVPVPVGDNLLKAVVE